LLFASTPRSSRRSLHVDPAGMLAASSGSSMEYLVQTIVDAGVPVEPLFSAVLEQAVRSAGGNFTHAAHRVGLTRAQLAYRVKTDRNNPRRLGESGREVGPPDPRR